MKIKDPKSCVIFKKTGDIHYYVCSVENYRAFYAIRMAIRKMWE